MVVMIRFGDCVWKTLLTFVPSSPNVSERAASQTQLIADVCDIMVPVTALGWASLDDGIVGIAGTVSSLLGVYGQWKKTA